MIKTEVSQRICPYTGLRSFTEEESLYFKGRDSQIGQITSLLEQNKFLMVTGASGEGKSSVIYAGLIPNARAGFFKAKYTNWLVADFRPERKPLHSMATAIADKFYAQTSTVETELKRGFSSLVDLYVNSEFYVDESDEKWLGLDESEKRNKKRKAANLLILVDQFEEFFTNPENFHNESPSQDSQIVVNLILETARIALKRGLPIYIVCTMRSDYIGQCSAFRGLAEYIGFSQFFVPRLKRKDLKQVIEEPAILSGNRISQRLIERLVFDLAEGIDQLPILQHALSQVWLAANNGMQEMDLIHYAMVGGMPVDELPTEDQAAFREWFLGLEEYKRDLYKDTGLNKIIEIHASVLYESAYDHYTNNYPDNPITRQSSKRIVALAFACLTKIDNSRAVRNRMTLQEITTIINEPVATTEIVGRVLDIFREEGNSFVRPFKTDDPATISLDAETVLDITHESLIRSWNKLDKWVALEFEYYSNYLDFKKQLDRWKASGKSSSYLLPIGPLSFFENWYNKCKPNIGWIMRYSERAVDVPVNEDTPDAILSDIKEFLKRSARKVMITRAFMKYGSQRIATILAIFIMLILSGFYWYDAVQKQNTNVVKRIKNEAHSLLASEDINNFNKGFYLINEERHIKGSLMNYLNAQEHVEYRTILASNSYFIVTLFDKKFNNPVKQDLINRIQEDMSKLASGGDAEFLLNQRVQFILQLAYDNYYNPGKVLEAELKAQSSALYNSIVSFFNNPRLYKVAISAKLNQAIQLWLTFGDAQPEKIKALIEMISPSGKGAKMFSVYYVRGSFEPNGIRPLDFNGGYHMLASLYSALGMTNEVIRCFEILKQQSDYFSDRVFNNFTNVIGYLYQFNHPEKIDELVQWTIKNTTRTEESIYNEMINRSGYISLMYRANYSFGGFTEEGSFQLNLCLSSREQFKAVAKDYEIIVGKLQNVSQRNFLLATHFKRQGIFEFKYSYDRGVPFLNNISNEFFSKSLHHFSLVDDAYLSEMISVTYPLLIGIRNKSWTRKEHFSYPDYIGGWLNYSYHSDIFFNYLKKENLLDQVYKTSGDLNMIHLWLTNAFEVRPFFEFESLANRHPLSDSLLINVLTFTSHHSAGESFDKSLVLLVLANRYLERKDTLEGMKYFREINFKSMAQWVNKYENVNRSFLLNQVRYLCAHLAVAGRQVECVQLAEKFEDAISKVYAYLLSSRKTYEHEQYSSSFILLDSAYSKARTINLSQIPGNRDFRFDFISFSAQVGGEKISSIANQFLKDMVEGRKFNGIFSMVNGYASTGNFYKALTYVPSTLTENQDLEIKSLLLWKAASAENVNKDYKYVLDNNFNWDYVEFGNGALN